MTDRIDVVLDSDDASFPASDNTVPVFDSATGKWDSVAFDHGQLAGLGDDDHAQYLTTSEALALIARTDFFCDSVTVTNGTIDSGDHTTVHTLDNTDLSISEVGGTPGLLMTFAFSGIDALTDWSLHGYYTGGHTVTIDLYNYDTTSYDNIGSFTPSGTFDEWLTGSIADDTNYIDGSGNAEIRINHPAAGNPTHDLFIDYLVLTRAYGGAGSIDHGALSGLLEDEHTQYQTEARVDTQIATHTADVDAHHAKYLDSEAVTAMGAKGDSNPLNHDRYADSEAVTAVEAENPLTPTAIQMSGDIDMNGQDFDNINRAVFDEISDAVMAGTSASHKGLYMTTDGLKMINSLGNKKLIGQLPRLTVYWASNQTISNGTDTAVDFSGATSYDISHGYASSPFTFVAASDKVTASGFATKLCRISGHIRWEADGGPTGYRRIAVDVGGTTVYYQQIVASGTTELSYGYEINLPIDTTSGAVDVEIWVRQNSGGNLDIKAFSMCIEQAED